MNSYINFTGRNKVAPSIQVLPKTVSSIQESSKERLLKKTNK
ncbi:hypothetical protein SynSYN20_00173 [Synechococcus sp. SYN20]|nr:hypothetical protein SynSYN20_00173 [Synechococcus sp. SYN20]